jgi:hypothetical protein
VHDAKAHRECSEAVHGSPKLVFSEIRAYMIRRAEELETSNNPIQLLKLREETHGMAVIVLGPTIDKGPTNEHFHFDSGARLSFGVTLRERDRGSELVAFRFHYQLPDNTSPAYFRFDLNETLHTDPLSEPRCHLHPGLDEIRLPLPLHDPIEILDRIFFVLEPAF